MDLTAEQLENIAGVITELDNINRVGGANFTGRMYAEGQRFYVDYSEVNSKHYIQIPESDGTSERE